MQSRHELEQRLLNESTMLTDRLSKDVTAAKVTCTAATVICYCSRMQVPDPGVVRKVSPLSCVAGCHNFSS